MTSLIDILEKNHLIELSKDKNFTANEEKFNDQKFYRIYKSIFEVVSKEQIFLEMFLENRWYYGVKKINGEWYYIFKKYNDCDSHINIPVDK